MKFYSIPILILLNFMTTCLLAQVGNVIRDNQPAPQINIQKTIDPIKLDGVLDEETWQAFDQVKNFTQYFPSDSLLACGDTEIYMAYDADNFYIAAKCYAPGNNFTVESLKRDYGFGRNDNISFLLDTYNDKTNAFLFGMNPYGVRREALISDGGQGREDFNPSWDNKWDGDSKMYDNYWICELSIPFKSIRYKEGSTKWRFNSYRNDAQCNEISCFINIPREYILMDLQYTAELNWEEPLDKPGQNISFIPYVSSSLLRDFEDPNQASPEKNIGLGADAKIAISSSLNLDLTYNPDFSQVEVDQQVTNLDRFEIFFPERRQFFLENADLFSGFGTSRVNPFFSRRIGISKDTVTDNNIQNKIYGGARLSGKINEKLRVGLINMQTAAQKQNDLPSTNYTVAALEHRVGARSNVAGIFVNKQSVNAADFGTTTDPYDRVAGLEYRLKSKNNLWTGKQSLLKAITPNDKEDKFSSYSNLEYNSEKIRIQGDVLVVGDGFDAEVGFIPRRDILLLSPEMSYRIFPKSDKISQHTLNLDTRWIYKLGKDDNLIIPDKALEERGVEFSWDTQFSNSHRFKLEVEQNDFTLLDDFDPTRVQSDDIFFAAGSQISNTEIKLAYNNDGRKVFSYRVSPLYSLFYGGTRLGVSGRFGYRFQPYGSINLQYNLNRIVLEEPFEPANLILIGPRLDITFTKKIFWTTFVQYNNQLDNLNINTRFQWRFAPVSDFYLVYTDNYNTLSFDPLASRNRALVAKLTYWLNL